MSLADPADNRAVSGRAILFYAGALASAIGIYLLIRQVGVGLIAPPVGAQPASLNPPSATAGPPPLWDVLLALTVVVLCARLLGALFQRIHQPPVIGEVVAGILLGPSLLGRVWPGSVEALFPPSVIPAIGGMAQLGVILFMFLVGAELDTSRLRERSNTVFAISHASIVVPFVLGAALSLYLYPRFSSADVSFTSFSLFLGVSMAVTAFPVLARILTDRGLQSTPLGTLALTCAAVGDATAWCLLAFVVGVVQAQLGAAAWTAILTLAYLAAMLWIVRPLIRRWIDRYEDPHLCNTDILSEPGSCTTGFQPESNAGLRLEAGGTGQDAGVTRKGALPSDQSVLAIAAIGLLLSCLATEWIGIHSIFGAFAFGALIRHNSRVSVLLHGKLYDFVVVLLLPAFFAMTGLRTQIGLVDGTDWIACALIVAVAFAGKLGGTMLAARLTGMGWRDASVLGILMNTRGLMELIVLNVGLDLGVISPRLFAMLVIMALATTLATTPILDRIQASRL